MTGVLNKLPQMTEGKQEHETGDMSSGISQSGGPKGSGGLRNDIALFFVRMFFQPPKTTLNNVIIKKYV